MSRAYKIKVSQRATHVLRANDQVSTHLELLEILPCDRMAELLENELKKRGFVEQGEKLIRRESDGVIIEIDPADASVVVKVESEKKVKLEGELQGWTTEPDGKQQAKEKLNLRKQLSQDLQRQAKAKEDELQQKLTNTLEGRLTDLRKELDQAVNRVTADALKEKAAAMGQIKAMTEDAHRLADIVLEAHFWPGYPPASARMGIVRILAGLATLGRRCHSPPDSSERTDLPQDVTPEQAVEAAYAAELAEVCRRCAADCRRDRVR